MSPQGGHVLLLSGTAQSAPNGSSKVERALARALPAHGFEATLLTRDTARLGDEPFTHATYPRPSSKHWKNALLAGRVGREIDRLHAARPFTILQGFELFPVGAYLAASQASRRLPVVLAHHELDPFRVSWARRTARRAAGVIALSEAQGERLRAGGLTVLDTIENGVDPVPLDEAARAVPACLPERFLLFAGRVSIEKGADVLAAAYAAVPPELRLPLLVIGDGPLVPVLQGVPGVVRLPWLPHEVLLAVLRRARAWVSPTRAELSPLLPVECFLRRIPVLISALPELAALERGADGARVEPVPVGDVGAWTAALAALGSGGEPDSARLDRAERYARARTWDAIAARYATVYRQCQAARAAAPPLASAR